MEYSRNVLVIQQLSTDSILSGNFPTWTSELQAEVQFYCPKTEECFQSIILESKSKAYSFEESLRRVVEKFMNKDYAVVRNQRHWTRNGFSCNPSKMIHEVQINLEGRVKDMFEDLFDMNWSPNVLVLKGDETIYTN